MNRWFWIAVGLIALLLSPFLIWTGEVAWLALTGQSFN